MTPCAEKPVHVALQAAGRMARFPPKHMVTTLVTFNRTLYAQLKQQEFQVGDVHPCALLPAVGLQSRAQALQSPGTVQAQTSGDRSSGC